MKAEESKSYHAKISSKGQIVIPSELRSRLGIHEGDRVVFHLSGNTIVLEPTISVPASQAWFWQADTQKKIAKSDADFKAGRSKRNTINKLIKELGE